MSIKTSIVKAAANVNIKRLDRIESKAALNQSNCLKKLISQAKNTIFGLEHNFDEIKSYQDFVSNIPVRDYEGLKKYFDKTLAGESNVLWPGKPKYLAKTSGTTSGTKYIPITKQSLSNHINSGRNALFSYMVHRPETNIFDGKMLFLSGSPVLEVKNNIRIGRLSGIVNHEIPSWMTKSFYPSQATNSLEPWEKKLDGIINEILAIDLRVVSGIPPWIQMMFERMLHITGKNKVIDLLPNLELYIHGGVNYEPYKERINFLVGKELNLVETYPASEGFIAFQDDYTVDGLRLISNDGIFYEFILKEEVLSSNPRRVELQDIEINKDYAIVLNSNAGLWGYLIGDLVRFVSKDPYRLKVTGRVSQFISAFGEHVISSEVEAALSAVIDKYKLRIVEFLVAPKVNTSSNTLPYHEWFIEFEVIPTDLELIAKAIDKELCALNSYYNDLIVNKVLQSLKISVVQNNGFKDYMTSINKIGEQFKVTRLCNDRKMADQLNKYLI